MRTLTFQQLVLFMLITGTRGFQIISNQCIRAFQPTFKRVVPIQQQMTTPGAVASSSTGSSEIKLLDGIGDIVDNYDIFLLDMWGVMHDGTNAYDGVLDAVSKLKEAGKELIILSNSSKRQDNSIKSLKKLGFDPSDFSQIVTSGEVAYHLLSKNSPDESALAPQLWEILEAVRGASSEPMKVFCFGSGAGDKEYIESCGCTLSNIDDADLIVARGTFTINDGVTVVDKTTDGDEIYYTVYNEAIKKAAERKIPMIVANPDKIRPDADKSPMPGTIGIAYETAMGDKEETNKLIKYIGKPFGDVYEIALRGKDRSRACMVGDALETDVTGGSAEGLDTIWVINDGIHNADVAQKGNGSLEEGCAAVLRDFNELDTTYGKGRKLSPTTVIPHFRW